MRQFKWFFIFTLICLIVSATAGQIYPYFPAKIYDIAAGQGSHSPTYWSDMLFLALSGFFIALIKTGGYECSFFIMAKFLPPMRTIIISDIFSHVNKLSAAYFNDEMSGRIATKFSQLEKSVNEFFMTFWNAADGLLWILVTFCILSFISLYFLPPLLLWLFFICLTAKHLGKKRLELGKETGKKESLVNGIVVDSITNYNEVRSFANFRFEQINLLKHLKALRRADGHEQKMKAYIHLTQNLLTVFSMLLFFLLSLTIFKSGRITTAEFIYATTLLANLSFIVFGMTWTYNNVSRLLGTMQSALDTLAAEPEISDKPGAKKFAANKISIVFDNAGFKYKGKRRIFKNLNISIKAGEKIGLVGHSGAGKSTLIRLLDRCYDVDSGAIKINGTDIRDITQESLHRHIAVIPQDISLFNRSLKENIRYGKTNATEEDIVKAAKQASADKFIELLPKKYDTIVGERGVILSGGERQRIAIARAILKNAPILIFDEATSALDSDSEKNIQRSLSRLMKNKTVLAIAHRLSTLREMDRILVLEKGKIIEEGSHASLLRKKGAYYKLYKMQSDGFISTSNLS